MNFRENKFLWVIFGIIILAGIISNLSHIITESWWFNSVHYSQVFWTILTWKSIVWAGAFILYGLFLWINFRIASRLTKDRSFISIEGASFKVPGEKIFSVIVGVVIAVIAFIAAGATLPWWQTVLKFLHSSTFANTDPIFHRNISFYFFDLPFLNGVQNWLLTLCILGLILSGALYMLKGAIQFAKNRGKFLSRGAKVHISVLLAVIALLIAAGFWLDRFQLLYSTGGVVFGAGYTDTHATLISYWVMAILTVFVAILFIISMFRKGIGMLATGVGIFVIALIIVNGLYPWFQQKFMVEPNELQKEKPYIKHNIDYTRQAYNLTDVQRMTYPAKGNLSQETLGENQATIQNIRLWDWRPLLSTYRQIQEIRLYYKFSDVDIDRYLINGHYRQLMLSAREFAYSQVPARAQTWQNQRLTYTHGYGVVASPVNIVTSEGLPELFIKDIPPVSDVDLKVTRPGIYYGEQTDHYVFTGTTTDEFDYPMGGENKFTRYDGKGGVPMSSVWRRALYAYQFGSIKILISGYFTNNSRVHYHRSIKDRVHNVAPFLQLDRDPYITIINGRLKWILDAYTTSDRYPYAEPLSHQHLNYIRNSVKVVVDAYDGTMDFYIVDESDPLVQTYSKIFPNLFKPSDQIPDAIRAHFRYPTDLFLLQSQIYLSYHMTEPEVFYNREDMWRFPTEIYEGNEQRMDPYYVIMRLPGHEKEEFLLISPFTPVNKNNMISWLAARSDGENYGKLILYEFPKQELIYGPMQIEARIDQDPTISEQLTLWSQKGSNVIRGNLLVVPVAGSLLYVEPLYLRSEQGQMPELKRVIVAYQNDIVMDETLEKALAVIFGQRKKPVASSIIQSLDISSLAKSALQTFQKAQDALQQGDWAGYGAHQQKLQQLLRQMQQSTKPVQTPADTE